MRLLRRFAPRNDTNFKKIRLNLFLQFINMESHCEERSEEAILESHIEF